MAATTSHDGDGTYGDAKQGQPKHTCQRCRDRRALFQHAGRVRADRDHTLCFECFRSERERQRAIQLAAAAGAATQPPVRESIQETLFPELAAGATGLTSSQVARRRRMLRNLEGKSPARRANVVRAGGDPA